MATAAGLISPGLVSLVRRAQQLRDEMEEHKTEVINIGSYNFNTFPRKNGPPLTTCKACSLDVLSHDWQDHEQASKKPSTSTDYGLNNNYQLDLLQSRPKSNYEEIKRHQQKIRPTIYYSEGEEALSSCTITDFEEDFILDETMENLESLKRKSSSSSVQNYSPLKRSLSDYQRPPLPPKKLTRSPSTEIANRVNKFEQLAKEGSPPKDDLNKGLWFYKDGLRSPTTPPPSGPRSRSSSLSNSTTSLPISVQVSLKETPSALQTSPANIIANNGQLEPKVITAALASSPKLFQKSERTVNLPAAFVLTTPKSSPPRTPRTPSPSEPSRPPRKRTPPIPPPRTNSSLLKKIELEAEQNKMKPLDLNQKVDQNLKLDEILDICADFEKQIQAEQEELRLIAQRKLQEEEEESSYGSVQFGAISFFPSTPPLPAKRGCSPIKSPTSSQWSPLNTLSPNRIKTNGSLPRETRRPQDFNGQSLSCQQNDVNNMFTFENPGYNSPQSTLNKQRAASAADKSPYENYPLFRGSQSPRTQIRTILPSSGTNGDTTDFIMNGAGEDFYSNYKSKEQLYIEAKHVLNMVEPYVSRNVNGVSPPQTVPRKPPRSKHDPGLNVMRPPSQEANQRVLIGTHMIAKQKSPEQTLSKKVADQHSNGISIDFKQDYQSQLQVVSTLKKQLNDLELIETEEINQLELERTLLNAEFDCETQKISKAKMKIALLKHKETRLSGIYEEFQKEFKMKLNEATRRMAILESNLDTLQTLAIDDHETELKIQAIKEQLEIEKKTFEDMEFHQMEESAHKETERDELLKEIKDLEKQVDNHEQTLNEIDKQQKELLKNVRNDTDELELRRKQLTANLNLEKDKMKKIEQSMKKHQQKFQDFTEETESETDDNESLNLKGTELDARLSRLALLDKTQQEINQISVATNSMSQQSPRKFYRISSQNMKIQLSTPVDFDTLNSIGSENGSSSDVHTESCYGSSNDLTNSKSLSKSNGVTLKTPKDPESTSGSGPSPDFISRPMSEESSVWDADEQSSTQVRRRHNKIQQRPLTRYLPIRNENFDLRAHIESAGHQIDQCNQVILAPDSCRGYLHKLSGNHQNTSAAVKSFRSKWNKRWFVFDRHKRAIIYYSDKSETKAKGGVYFQSIEEVYVDHLNHVKSPNAKMTFCMKTAERTYFLMAPSPESMRIWVDVIFTGAEGYQEFQQL